MKCIPPFADCDGNPSNGCEINTSNDADNCTTCGQSCPALNGAASCIASECQIVCAPGFKDCDDNRSNGCETKTDRDVNNCGVCGKVCDAGNGTAWCNKGVCGVSNCPPGFGDCNADPGDGCEVDLTSDSASCKTCGSACVVANGVASCTNATCGIASCSGGYSNCFGGYADGCETPTASDPNNCGGCGLQCKTNNAVTSVCVSSNCAPTCNDGWGACSDPSAGCVTKLDTVSNCGNCGNSCANEKPFCVDKSCASHLPLGIVDSDTNGVTTDAGGSLTFQHSLQSAAGHRRLLLVGVTGFGNGNAGQPASVQYAGVDMIPAREVLSGAQVFSGVYYLPDSALPTTAGPYSVSVGASDVNNTFALAAHVLELVNAEQSSGAIDSVGGSGSTQSCAIHKASDTVMVSSEGELIYSIAAVYGSLAAANANASGQQIAVQLHSAYLDTIAGSLTPTGTGTRTVTWSLGGCNATAHALVSIKPATTP